MPHFFPKLKSKWILKKDKESVSLKYFVFYVPNEINDRNKTINKITYTACNQHFWNQAAIINML